MSEKTPDQVGGYDWMLVYDSGDTWEDSGYAYSRTAEGPMNEQEAKLQFSTHPKEERPVLYKLVTPEQIAAALALYDNREEIRRAIDRIATMKRNERDWGSVATQMRVIAVTALSLLQAENEGGK